MKRVLFIFIVLTIVFPLGTAFARDSFTDCRYIYYDDRDYKYDKEEARKIFDEALELYAPDFKKGFMRFELFLEKVTVYSGEMYLKSWKPEIRGDLWGKNKGEENKIDPFLRWEAKAAFSSGCLGFNFNILKEIGQYELSWENEIRQDLISKEKIAFQTMLKLKWKF